LVTLSYAGLSEPIFEEAQVVPGLCELLFHAARRCDLTSLSKRKIYM